MTTQNSIQNIRLFGQLKIKKQLSKTEVLEITAELRRNSTKYFDPYFSVTSELWTKTNLRSMPAFDGDYEWRNGRIWYLESCGCQHDLVLEHCPELKPLVQLHLCDYEGRPMHTLSNGNHFLYTKPEIVMKSFRITEDTLNSLKDDISKYKMHGLTLRLLRRFGIIKQWQDEAKQAFTMLNVSKEHQQFIIEHYFET